MDNPYFSIRDKFGSTASVFFDSKDGHYVTFVDYNGREFFRETFSKDTSIDFVENAAIDWATSNRQLTIEAM